MVRKSVKCHPERQRRIYYRSEEDGKISFKVIDSSLRATIPFSFFSQGILTPVQNDNWMKERHNEGNVNRHPKANVKDLYPW